MKKLLLILALFPSTAFADVFIPPVVVQQPEQIVVAQPPRVLQKQIKWVMTPKVIEINIPTVVRYGVFGQAIVRNNKSLITVWEWTPVEVWE